MKITKYHHSCLLIKDQGKTYLFDPGNYTFDENALDVEKMDQLDCILLTHEHADHMFLPLLQQLVKKFPHVQIIGNSSIQNLLAKEGIHVSSQMPNQITYREVVHERMFDSDPPQNWLFEVHQTLTHPGDSHHFTLSTPVLALPLQAPWGSVTQAITLALELKPQTIVPIHDWHLKDKARVGLYSRLVKLFEQRGITFIPWETGIEIEI